MFVCEVALAPATRRISTCRSLLWGDSEILFPPLEEKQVHIHRIPALFHDTDHALHDSTVTALLPVK